MEYYKNTSSLYQYGLLHGVFQGFNLVLYLRVPGFDSRWVLRVFILLFPNIQRTIFSCKHNCKVYLGLLLMLFIGIPLGLLMVFISRRALIEKDIVRVCLKFSSIYRFSRLYKTTFPYK